jgi:hypothetical protein
MLSASPETVLETLADALHTMAFIALEPPPDDLPAPQRVSVYSIQFHGPARGEVQIAAPLDFGRMLSGNMLAIDPASDETRLHAPDAIKELCNVTSGLLLRRLHEEQAARGGTERDPEMGLPSVTPLADESAWKQFVSQPGAVVVIAEGHPLAVHIKEQA